MDLMEAAALEAMEAAAQRPVTLGAQTRCALVIQMGTWPRDEADRGRDAGRDSARHDPLPTK